MSVQEEYELLEKIGTGSFGSVFLALQRASADRPERKVRARAGPSLYCRCGHSKASQVQDEACCLTR